MAATLALVLVGCQDPDSPSGMPPSIAGKWSGEAGGIGFRVLLEERQGELPSTMFLEGSAWLVFGAPAESLAVSASGTHSAGGGAASVVINLTGLPIPGSCCRYHGQFLGQLSNGRLSGTFTRPHDSEAADSPLPSRWTGTTAQLTLIRP